MDTPATFEIPPQAWYTHLLLENPWPLAVSLLTAALIVLAIGVTRGQSAKRWAVPSAICTIAAVAIMALAHTVATPVEQMTNATRILIDSAVAGDADRIRPLLADDFDVSVENKSTRWGADGVLARIPSIPQLIRSNHVRNISAAIVEADRIGVSVFDQTTTPAITGQPTPNRWRCIWTRAPDGAWKLAQLRWETWGFGQTPPADVLTSFSPRGG